MSVEVVRLDSIAEVRLGRQRSPKDHEGPQMRPYVRAANVGWEGWKLDDVKYMNFTDAEMSVYGLRRGDLLLGEASGSATEVGKPAIWDDEIEDCAFQNTLIRVRPRKAEPRYLLHYFKFLAGTGKFAARSRGVGINHLGSEALASWEVPLPPIEEQRRIAAILDKADELRDKRRTALSHLDSLGESIFLDMFGDPATTSAPFRSLPIGELATVTSGSTPRRNRSDYYGGTIPWVKTAELANGSVASTEESLTELGLRESACRVFPRGSVLVALYGQGKTRGTAAVLSIDAATNQACGVILPSSRLRPKFLLAQLRLSYERLRDLGRGGSQENLNLEHLRSFGVLVPELTAQDVFIERLSALEPVRDSAQCAADALDHLFGSLQQRAFARAL